MSHRRSKRTKRKHGALDLEGKVRQAGGQTGFGLDVDATDVTASVIGGGGATLRSLSGISRGRSRGSTTNTTLRSRAQQQKQRPVAAAHTVCAISENLAKETCVASLDAGTPVALHVTKQGNGQTYAETLAYLELLDPDEVLLNEGRRNSQLARKILELYSLQEEMPQLPGDANQRTQGTADPRGPGASTTVVKFISRACFDQTKGAELLQRVAREETYDASVVDEYILLSSAHAVLHYTQQNLGASFSRKCLHLMVNSGGTNKMVIDRSTILQLELLANAKSGKTKCSLISTIDHTKTSVGQRLLRTNLMSPPTRVDTITSRLDLVDSFLADEDFFFAVMEHLQNLPCLDKMLTNISLIPRERAKKSTNNTGVGIEVTKRIARKGISALVGIKTTLSALPGFISVLEDRLAELDSQHGGPHGQSGTAWGEEEASTIKSSLLLGLGGGSASDVSKLQRNHLLRAIVLAMKNPLLNKIYKAVTEVFTSSTTSHRSAHAMRHEECFALKAEETSMIAFVRKAFLTNVDDIYSMADKYAEENGFYVSVRYSASRGYFLAVPEETTNLPSIFIHPSKNGRFIHCTTEEVASLNIRAQDNYQDLLFMTDAKIQEVLDVARSHYDALASLSDATAILDMCHGFADCVSLKNSKPWCRPVLRAPEEEAPGNNNTGMVIRNGRYAIEVEKDGQQEFIANDTYTSALANFTVITGINGSGKSTYLKQIAIMVVLAHCGGYVPAEYASIPICHRLCTRIGNTDDQENNLSTFMHEMKETAFICRNATPQSLILIDELGRATSNEDGVAIAWAVSERLLRSNAITFFVTHYPQVTLLGNMYCSVQNQHMEASVGNGAGGEIMYTHKVSTGPCSVSTSYGVELAGACGWPSDVLEEAKQIESNLRNSVQGKQLFPNLQSEEGLPTSRSSSQTVEQLIGQLKSLMRTSPGEPSTFSSIREKLEAIEKSAGGELRSAYNDICRASATTERLAATRASMSVQDPKDVPPVAHVTTKQGNDSVTLDSASHRAIRMPGKGSKAMYEAYDDEDRDDNDSLSSEESSSSSGSDSDSSGDSSSSSSGSSSSSSDSSASATSPGVTDSA